MEDFQGRCGGTSRRAGVQGEEAPDKLGSRRDEKASSIKTFEHYTVFIIAIWEGGGYQERRGGTSRREDSRVKKHRTKLGDYGAKKRLPVINLPFNYDRYGWSTNFM